MSSGFFSFMRGGVNRLIEQRKAAEQAAYDKSIREETEAATIRAEGRQQDKTQLI